MVSCTVAREVARTCARNKWESMWAARSRRLKSFQAGRMLWKSPGKARESYQVLSRAMIDSMHAFGPTRDKPIYLIHCPMAFNNTGADWLQDAELVANPYFGASMLRCGTLKETIPKAGK